MAKIISHCCEKKGKPHPTLTNLAIRQSWIYAPKPVVGAISYIIQHLHAFILPSSIIILSRKCNIDLIYMYLTGSQENNMRQFSHIICTLHTPAQCCTLYIPASSCILYAPPHCCALHTLLKCCILDAPKH